MAGEISPDRPRNDRSGRKVKVTPENSVEIDNEIYDQSQHIVQQITVTGDATYLRLDSGNDPVYGQTKFEDGVDVDAFKMPTGALAEAVLTSDASGNGTWQGIAVPAAPTALAVDTNIVVQDDSGNNWGVLTITFEGVADEFEVEVVRY